MLPLSLSPTLFSLTLYTLFYDKVCIMKAIQSSDCFLTRMSNKIDQLTQINLELWFYHKGMEPGSMEYDYKS